MSRLRINGNCETRERSVSPLPRTRGRGQSGEKCVRPHIGRAGLHRTRSGFSLLEMVLALALGMLVLAGVYMALSVQFSQAQAGREVLEEGILARSILTRIANDIVNNLGPAEPSLLAEGSATSSASSSASTSAPTTTTSTETAPSTESADTASTDTSNASSSSAGLAMQFNLGVLGEANRLVLSVSRLPRGPRAGKSETDEAGATVTSDLRRITYWLAEGRGLARQELTDVTGDRADILPPDGVESEKIIIAPEVKELTFQYFDGTSWQSSWDGTAPGPDGETPVGPPAAIEIILKLQFRVVHVGQTDTMREIEYRHTVALPTANNFAQTGNQ